MNAFLYADLEHHIQRWTDKHCVGDKWPEIWVGPRTIELAAKAARNVFDAIEDSRKAEKEGN